LKVFISYRRADSGPTAGRMAQFLDTTPVVNEVFLDVDDIVPGVDFEQKIQDTLARVSHVFVVIGPQWTGPADPAGTPGSKRIFDPKDMVRREMRLALASGVKVVPILVDGARIPPASELPDDLKALSSVNAFELRTAHFDEDMDDLLDVLLGRRPGRGSRWREAPLTPIGIAWRTLAGALAGGLLLLGVALINQLVDSESGGLVGTLQKTFRIVDDNDALGLMWMIGIAVVGLGGAAPFLPRWLRRRR